jgi:hypothetical protein
MGGSGWKPHRDVLGRGRFYAGGVDPQFEIVNGAAPPALLALPALLMPEVDGSTGQTARVAAITSAKIYGTELRIEYVVDPDIPPLSVSKIVELAPELDIETSGFYLAHTHWTVNDADLFKVLLRHRTTETFAPTVFEFDHHRDSNLVGVMMPFEAGFDNVYAAIKVAATEAGYRCKRADDLWLHDKVVQTIVSLICQSGIVIADVSRKNANVFYEVGIAHSFGKQVILLVQSINDVPFDLQHLSILTYFPNREGLMKLATDLAKRIRQVANPVRRA